MPAWLAVALGGALGALARHSLNEVIQFRAGPAAWSGFPLATLLINVSGCFLLGCILGLVHRNTLSENQRLALGTGFVGSFTTFSAFIAESNTLINASNPLPAYLYVLGNLVLGYAAYLAGRQIAVTLT